MLRHDVAVVKWNDCQGIRHEIGLSVFLLAFLIVPPTGTVAEVVADLSIFMMVIAALALREAIRAWAAGVQGLKLFAVKLSAAGGHVEHSRADRVQEEFVAAMGPVTSLWLWAVAATLSQLLPAGATAAWMADFALVNLFIGAITALPALPLDGGRFLYLYLGRTVSEHVARRVIGVCGLVLSVLWLPAMLMTYLFTGLVLLALPSIQEHWEMVKGAAPVAR
ncbi:hypothetical protein HKCCE3408_14235 [Rhodobacterales bacterium HKCCE3408]|nr:hypothetical protein [Rhodobacterales bacterium HKCCE3408]